MPAGKSFIGKKGEPVTMHVERGKIREFARARQVGIETGQVVKD